MSPGVSDFDAQCGASLSLVNDPRATESNITLTSPLTNTSIGREEGNNSRPGHEDEPQDLNGEDIPLGTGEHSVETPQSTLNFEDIKMKLEEIEKRFNQQTKTRYKPEVKPTYVVCFRNFWKSQALEGCTKQTLAGKKGRNSILDYIETVPRGSWSNYLAKLKSVWLFGVGLPWPINNKLDIGPLPKPRPEQTPSNGPVKEWAGTMSREKDPYSKLVWLFIAQHGWRPSHAKGVRWSDVRYDEHDKPFCIIASGAGAEFKTYAPVAVRLAPDVIEALDNWRHLHPDPNGNAFILPHRLRGRLDATKKMSRDEYLDHWYALMKKYGLPKLRPKDLRHWVSTACRKAGLSKRASAYLQGHDADGGSSMRDWYDNVPLEEILQEQADCFPHGPLATVLPVDVELIPDIPPEAVTLLSQFLSGELDSYEFMPLIVNVRKKMDKPSRMTV